MLAASLKQGNPRRGCRLCGYFREQMLAASLKHRQWAWVETKVPRFPRANARGLIEASNRHSSRCRYDDFREQMLAASLKPDNMGQGSGWNPHFREQMLAASLKRGSSTWRSPARDDFREQMLAASLKRLACHVVTVANVRFPRANARGLIEACGHGTSSRRSGGRFPRANARGLIEATRCLVRDFLGTGISASKCSRPH